MDNFDTNSNFYLEQAGYALSRTKAQYNSLSEKDKRWIDKIRAIKPGRYDADFMEATKIVHLHDNNAINAFRDIFNFGFIKGQRAEKARMKKKAQTNRKKERVLN